nr:putative reverse transcriptase domain-containing protein [Tanacetum cinerariifolium]
MEFQVRDKVMLKVFPWKGVIRFSKRGKLNPRYVGPFKKCHADEPLAVPLDGLHFDDKLHFVEEPVEIVDREVKQLKRSRIPLVKVRWNSKREHDYHSLRDDLEAIEELVNRHVEEALAAYEATCAANTLEAENQSQNGSDGDNGNGGNGNGRNENPNENGRGDRPVARECTYQDLMKCQPLNFKGTKGVVRLTRWFEKMETVFHINHCPEKYQVKMVLEEEDRIERYVGGLPDNIQGNVAFAEPTRLQDAIQLANSLMDQKLKGYAVKNDKNKRRSDCPKLKDQNNGNKAGNKNGVGEARGKAYVLGRGDVNPNSNVVKGTFLLNNHYAFVLFDSGTDRSFVLSTFNTLLDIIPDTLDVSYDVELADERISKTNVMLRGYTLGLLGHPFNVNLMPVELGSFDVIIMR